MGFDGLGAEMQEAGNLLGGMPFGNQLEDFALADGQRSWHRFGYVLNRVIHALQIAVNNVFGDSRTEIGFTPGHSLHGQFEFGRCRVFEQIAGCPHPQCLADVLFVFVHGQHNHLDPRAGFHDLCGRVQAVESLHGHIHENDIRLVLLNETEGVPAVIGFGYHFDVGNLFEEGPNPGTDQGVVIGQKNTNRLHTTTPAQRGKRAQTSVPLCGADTMLNLPPTSSARSCMLNTPILRPWIAASRACVTLNPTPSS